jgi:hypothetical protein
MYLQIPSITGGRSSIRNPKTCHAVVTGTHLTRLRVMNIVKIYTGDVTFLCNRIVIVVFSVRRDITSEQDYNVLRHVDVQSDVSEESAIINIMIFYCN